jgi:hypothetical protein
MSKNTSDANILEVINNSSEVREAIANGYTVIYQSTQPVINNWPTVGIKRKFPFETPGPYQMNGIKKARKN